jgi:hypothetical protein
MLVGTAGHLATCPDLGPECKGSPPPTPYYHHVGLFTSEISLDASYGLTPWLAAEVRFALRIVDTKPTYSELDGRPKLVPNDIHHHDATLAGPADPWLVLRFGAARGKFTTAARLGVSLPLGRTQPNPYALAEEGKWHEHTQFGAGTFLPIIGLGLSYAFDPVELSASGLALFSLYENGYGYRAPSSFFFSVRATMPFRSGTLRPYLAADLPHQTDELWSGAIGAEGPTARTELLLGAGVSWEFRAPWSVDLGLRAKVASFTDAATFKYPGLLQLGIGTHFDFARKEASR